MALRRSLHDQPDGLPFDGSFLTVSNPCRKMNDRYASFLPKFGAVPTILQLPALNSSCATTVGAPEDTDLPVE